MNRLLIKLLDSKIEWIDVNLSKEDKKEKGLCSYRQVLICTENHGNDLQVIVGYLLSKNNYTDFDVFRYNSNYTDPCIVDKDKILALGLFKEYYI